MFSSIVSNIRDKFAVNKNKPPPTSNTMPDHRKLSIDHTSGDEDDDQHLHVEQHLSRTISSPTSSLHRPRTSMDEAAATANNTNIGRKMSVTEAIPVQRRKSTFGISNVSADDYIQKDLISSSWS